MAYVHCHNCDWSQDDFWDFSWGCYGYWHGWRYNPFSLFLRYVGDYWWPRVIEFDVGWAEEQGWPSHHRHSWRLLWDQFVRIPRKFRKQKWWTYKVWERAIDRNVGKWPACPHCGAQALDID